MTRLRSLVTSAMAHPAARVGLAFLLLLASVGGLSLVAYADQYVNGGVTWGQSSVQIPLAQVNPMGINLFLEKEPDRNNVIKSLQLTKDAGFKWIRQDFAWNDIEISGKGIYTDTRNPGAPVSAWDKYDFIVDEANQFGLQIMARLDSPPDWARIPGDDTHAYPKGPPNNNSDFGDFAAAVAQRYKGKISYFQIWNEPNLIGEWGGHPVSAEEYTALLKTAYQRIKAVNPDAVIIMAALAPTTDDTVSNQNDILFLESMYRAGAAPYFDVMSTMLYGLGQSPDDRRADFKRLSFSRPILLRQVMEQYHDDKKPIWISEYAWISLPSGWDQGCAQRPPDTPCGQNIWGNSVDEVTQGRYLVEGYERARAEWPWMGVMFVWHLRNPDGSPIEPATYFSILNPDFTPRPAYNMLKDYSAQVPDVPTPQSKPLWNLIGFPLLYIIFGVFSFASGGYALAGIGRWASAALDTPRGKFSEEERELARNGVAVVGMALLFVVYYRAESLPIIVTALLGWLLLAILKPGTGLAMVASAIPLFWLPKPLGAQNYPIAETMLVLVLLAVLARRLLVAFLPATALRLHITTETPPTSTLEAGENSKETRPLYIGNSKAASGGQSIRSRFFDLNAADAFGAPAIAMLLLGSLSLFLLANPDFAPDSARAFRWTIVEPVLFYFLIKDVVKGRRALLRMLDFFMVAAVLVAFYGLWQSVQNVDTLVVEGVSRIVSVYEQPNNLALYMGRALPLAVCLALFLPMGARKVAYALAVPPLAATLILTFSRGGWVGVSVAVVVGVSVGLRWGWGWIRPTVSQGFRRWLMAVAAAVVLLGVVGLVLLPKLPERILDPGSSLLRFTIWGSAVHMIADHPLFGIGPDQFLNQFQSGYGPCQVVNGVVTSTQQGFNECFTSHPHDIFLDYWLTLGIMGLIVLVWLLWRYYRESINIAKWAASKVDADPLARALALGLIASMTDFFVHGLVDNSYFLMDLALIFWMSCATIQLLRERMGLRGH